MQNQQGIAFQTQNNVLQIYENNPRIPIWIMGFGQWLSRVSRGGDSDGDVTGTGSDTVVKERGQVRYNIKCKPNAGEGSGDHKKNLQRGWSDSPDDFVNIEQTGFIDVTELASQDKNQDITWYGPSGRHHGSGGSQGCKGSTYKGSLHASRGCHRMAKENWHVNYTYEKWNWFRFYEDDANENEYAPDHKHRNTKFKDLSSDVRDFYIQMNQKISNIVKQLNGQNKRVGFKWVNYKIDDYRRLEVWVDIGGAIAYNEQPKNEWQLIRVHEDHSDFGESIDDCGCDNEQQAILWGGPYCTYRWDDRLAVIQQLVSYPLQQFKK